MGDLMFWLLSFFFHASLVGLIGYQLICLADLEFDYMNPYESSSRINRVILPEYIAQALLCFIHLVTGNWIMLLFTFPYLYYNARLYRRRQHLLDVTEIFNQLSGEKQLRLFKLAYLILLLTACIFWLFLVMMSLRLDLLRRSCIECS